MPGRIQRIDGDCIHGEASAAVQVRQGTRTLALLPAVFSYPIPSHCKDGAEHWLHFSCGTELKGSPVRIQVREEKARIPYASTDWTGRSVLCLAPHPDDETLGCGGSLALHRQRGDSVQVVVLTDGGSAGSPGQRQEEARRACRILDLQPPEFWEYPDRALPDDGAIVERLARLLDQTRPGLIYCTSPWEYNPDHRAACLALARAARRVEWDADVLLYEIGFPLPVNSLVDVTSVHERKVAAGSAYTSQLELYPYVELMDGLNRYRSHTLGGHGYCEGFYHLRLSQLASRPLAAVPAAHLPDRPVSIVVRTRNRPRLLREALESLAGQSYGNLEAVVVNDGGEDPGAVLKGLEPHLSFRVLNLPATGRSGAGNAGCEAAGGDYFGFLDDDDLLRPEHVSKLAGFLQATGERFAYSDCEKTEYRWTGSRFVAGGRTLFSRDHDSDELYANNYIPNMCPLFSKDLWAEAGPLDTSLAALEDWDLWLRMSRCAQLCHLPGVTAEYRVFGPRDYDNRQLTERLWRKHAEHMPLARLFGDCRHLRQELSLRRRPWWQKVLARLGCFPS